MVYFCNFIFGLENYNVPNTVSIFKIPLIVQPDYYSNYFIIIYYVAYYLD